MKTALICALIIITFFGVGLYPIFFGRSTFMSGDNVWWYGTFQYFVESVSQGVFPFWAPYMHTGEPFYFLVNHFRLTDPLMIFPILITKCANVNLLTLYHGFYLVRIFVFLMGNLFLLKYLFVDSMALIYTFTLLLGVVNFFGIFASFFHLDTQCWAPWIILFAIRAYQERTIKYYLLTGLFIGISVGATTYLSLFFLAFIATFGVCCFFLSGQEFLLFLKSDWKKIVGGLCVALLVALPLVAIVLDKNNIFPVTRIFGARNDLDHFLKTGALNQSYHQIFGVGGWAGHYLKWKNLLIYVVGRGHGPDTLFHFFVFLAIVKVRFPFKLHLILTSIVMYVFALASETPVYHFFFNVVPGFKMLRHTIGFIDCLPIIKSIFAYQGLKFFLDSKHNIWTKEVKFYFLLMLPFVFQMIFRAKFRFLGGYDVPWKDIKFLAAAMLLSVPFIRLIMDRQMRVYVLGLMVLGLSYYTLAESKEFMTQREAQTKGYHESDFRKRPDSFDPTRILNVDNNSSILYEGLILKRNLALSTVLEPPSGMTKDDISYLKYWKGGGIGNRAIYWPFNYTYVYLAGERNYQVFKDLTGIGSPIIRFYPMNHVLKLPFDEMKKRVADFYENEKTRDNNILDYQLIVTSGGNNQAESSKIRTDFSYRVERFNANLLELTVTNKEAGNLLFIDSFDPHWKVFVNQKLKNIHLANINYKAVDLGPGVNNVRFEYKPTLFICSLFVYGGVLVGFLCYFVALFTIRVFRPSSSSPHHEI